MHTMQQILCNKYTVNIQIQCNEYTISGNKKNGKKWIYCNEYNVTMLQCLNVTMLQDLNCESIFITN